MLTLLHVKYALHRRRVNMPCQGPFTYIFEQPHRLQCRPMTSPDTTRRAIVIGGGPAGLMAAEILSTAGVRVDLYDAMASSGRKFLLAGKGGMNITHSEDFAAFASRYGARSGEVGRW